MSDNRFLKPMQVHSHQQWCQRSQLVTTVGLPSPKRPTAEALLNKIRSLLFRSAILLEAREAIQGGMLTASTRRKKSCLNHSFKRRRIKEGKGDKYCQTPP